MKKLFALLLALVLCLSLCACGGANKDDIREELQGTWRASWTTDGARISRYYTFEGDRYTTGGVAFIVGELEPKSGTYKISNSTIRLTPDDGSEGNELDYSYDKETGTLTLWWSDDIELVKTANSEAAANAEEPANTLG